MQNYYFGATQYRYPGNIQNNNKISTRIQAVAIHAT